VALVTELIVGQGNKCYMKTIVINNIKEFVLNMPMDTDYYSWIYRGEDAKYDYRLPAIWRLNSNIDRQAQHVKTSGISRLIIDNEIMPRIDYSYGIPCYKGAWLGEYDLCGYQDGIPSLKQIYWQIVALLQHYGYSTAFLDITFDPRVALFFSCYSALDGKTMHNGYGYIYQWERKAICETMHSKVLLTSLSKLSSFLKSDDITLDSRPESQAAGSLRVGIGAEHEPDVIDILKQLDSLATVYIIERNSVPVDYFQSFEIFPEDSIPTLIRRAAKNWSYEVKDAINESQRAGDDKIVEVLERALNNLYDERTRT
jgi:hypothetical protein